MSDKVIEAELGITRSNDGFYYIRIGCNASHVSFCELKLTAKQFAEAVTSLHTSGIHGTVRALELVGKEHIRERRQVLAPDLGYGSKPYEQWLIDNCQEEGWMIDKYLNSQSSIRHGKDSVTLNYSVFKYVEVVK